MASADDPLEMEILADTMVSGFLVEQAVQRDGEVLAAPMDSDNLEEPVVEMASVVLVDPTNWVVDRSESGSSEVPMESELWEEPVVDRTTSEIHVVPTEWMNDHSE